MTFNKGDRCFSSVGFEFEYVCLMPDGKHIVRPVLETSEGEEIFGDLRQVDAVYTAEECDGLKYAKREALQTEIEELERKRASLRLTTSQEEALAQHETLANLADWLAGKKMYFVACDDLNVEVKSTDGSETLVRIQREREVTKCRWYINGDRATYRGMFGTKEQAEEVARRIVASNLAGESAWWPRVEPAIVSAQRLGVPVPQSLLDSRAARKMQDHREELERAQKTLRAAQERVNQLVAALATSATAA